jgi:hypothetical protein
MSNVVEQIFLPLRCLFWWCSPGGDRVYDSAQGNTLWTSLSSISDLDLPEAGKG